MDIELIVKILLLLSIGTYRTNLVLGEWVDIPQFSDERKVYRVPFTKSNRYKIFTTEGLYNIARDTLSNSSEYDTNIRSKDIQIPFPIKLEITTLSYSPESISDRINTHKKASEKIITMLNYFSNNESTTMINPNIGSTSARPTTETVIKHCEDSMTKKVSTDPVIPEVHKSDPTQAVDHDVKGTLSFLQYLPMGLIKRIHENFMKNTKTLQEKQRFLKNFLKSLLQKLESKLTSIFNPVRRKRGSGWDEHDDHVGFPSLEGALLAISFLTFAVYLIQLVMMLLRNLGNNAPNIPNTVLVNRNRSVDQLSEDSIRILEHLDRFPHL